MNHINEKKMIFYTCLFSTISFFLIDFYLPSFPNITDVLSSNPSTTKMMVSCYLFGIGISQLIYGTLSDKYGRKNILLFGIMLALIANTLAVFVVNLPEMLILRILTGLGAGACPALARAALADCFEGGKLLKANSYLSMSITMSPAIAPVIGGVIQEMFGWKVSFLLVSAWCLLTILMLIFYFNETLSLNRRNRINLGAIAQNYKKLLTDKDFISSAMVSCLAVSASLSYYIITPFIFQTKMHLSPSFNGAIYILNAVANLFGAFYISRKSKSSTPEILLNRGINLAIIGTVAMSVCSFIGLLNLYVIVLPMLLVNFAFGLIMPTTGTIAIRKFKSMGGACAAMLGFFRMGGSALITSAIAYLEINSQFNLSLALMAIFGVAYMILRLSTYKLTTLTTEVSK